MFGRGVGRGVGRDLLVETPDHVDERVGVLGAGDRPLSVDHERRHGGDAAVDRLVEVGGDLGPTAAGFEEVDHVLSGEADLGRAVGQHLGVADVQAVDEVRLEQALLEGALIGGGARELGQPEQAVGEQRVGAQCAIHPELDAFAGGLLRDAFDDRSCLVGAAELLGVCLDDRLALAG